MNSHDHEGLYDEVAPDPSSMIESMRAAGYSLQTAVADLIDNSITARAQNVWLTFFWEGPQSWVRLTDDGTGMNEERLRNAMRLGSRHPLQERDERDLGRFGLGLKTASLSQCRRLTVASRWKGSVTHVRRWDLDHLARPEVHNWQLLRSPAPGSTTRIESSEMNGHGTVVLWEDVDRLVDSKDAEEASVRSHFFRQVEHVERHLGMVFHRYLAGPRPRLQIHVNGNQVQSWDPFLDAHPATQPYPVELIRIPGCDGEIRLKGFVLPHKDRLGDDEHGRAAGPAGWNAQQGFYVYRNERLILPGDWLGLGKDRPWTKEEHYKLARIRIDIPNSMDHLWLLDVKKSSATPPAIIRDRLHALATDVRKRAREVFAHRGRYGKRRNRDVLMRPWKAVHNAGMTSYRVDRAHPLVQSVRQAMSPELRDELDAMLRIIEETVPVQQIWLDAAEHPDAPSAPFEGSDDVQLRRIIEIAYGALRKHKKLSHGEAVAHLVASEEFSDDRAAAIINTLTREKP